MSGPNGQHSAERALRIALFTDTLGDVNGVSRFINDIADHALARDLPLHVLTSTRFPVRSLPTLHNFRPRAATAIPGYPQLQIVLPPLRRLARLTKALKPDVIHVSTPGPIGMAGRMIARRLGIPLAGVYHTDFPAYVDRLFEDDGLTHVTQSAMRRFYRPFKMVFSRSAEYAESLAHLGIHPSKRAALRPGINTTRFDPRFRDQRCWEHAGVRASSIKVLFTGRVSVEKNMPLLAEIWKRVRSLAPDVDATLVVIGDGPYRAEMEPALADCNARFLGFRHGEDLSRLYASSDLFVFPSVTDTLGQVVLESQASGLPALVSDVGGPKEVVREGKTGYVLSTRNINAWADRIVRLLRDTSLRQALGHEASRHASQFSIQRSFEDFWHRHGRIAGWSSSAAEPPEPPPNLRRPELDSVPA